jgi:hypothetical protein
MDAENLAPTGIQSLNHPACSESLYDYAILAPEDSVFEGN